MRCSNTQKNLCFMVGLLIAAPTISIGVGYAAGGREGAVIGIWSTMIFDLCASIGNVAYHHYGFFDGDDQSKPRVDRANLSVQEQPTEYKPLESIRYG